MEEQKASPLFEMGQVSLLKINSCFETCIHNLYYNILIPVQALFVRCVIVCRVKCMCVIIWGGGGGSVK